MTAPASEPPCRWCNLPPRGHSGTERWCWERPGEKYEPQAQGEEQ